MFKRYVSSICHFSIPLLINYAIFYSASSFSNTFLTAVSPGPSGGLPTPGRPPSPALSSLSAPLPCLLCLLASPAPMLLSPARFTRSLVPSLTVRPYPLPRNPLVHGRRENLFPDLNPSSKPSQSISIISPGLYLTYHSSNSSQVRG